MQTQTTNISGCYGDDSASIISVPRYKLSQIETQRKKNYAINKRSHVNLRKCLQQAYLLRFNPETVSRHTCICLLLPFSRHFAFILTTIFPDFVISNNIALCVFSLRVSSWRGRLDSLFLRSAFVVIKARSSCPPCRIGKSASRSSSNSTCVSSSHELFSVCAFYCNMLICSADSSSCSFSTDNLPPTTKITTEILSSTTNDSQKLEVM